jgi:cytochrome c peroxidase
MGDLFSICRGEGHQVSAMIRRKTRKLATGAAAAALTFAPGFAYAQQAPRGKSSYMPVDIQEPFSAIFGRLSAQKPDVTREHMSLLDERYDLSDRPAAGVTMDRTKPVQEGVRVKLPAEQTWESLANMSPEQIRDRNLFPKGFYPLPHPKHQEGGFVFPHFVIDEIKRQEGRDLTRFDVEYDIPDHFLPEFPPAMYLNQRTDLGDISQDKLVTIENYYELFNGILTPKQLEGLRACHAAPYYTDNLMHDLQTERFFKPQVINGLNETGDGAVKTFPLRGIKDSPPYLHDGRLLTLDDTVEFFNLVLGTKLTGEEKRDLVAFLRTL